MKNRTLSIVSLIVLVTLAILVYQKYGNWFYVIPLHAISGAIAFELGFSDRPRRKLDLVDIAMCIMSIVFGFISITATSFFEMEGHEEGDIRIL